MSSDDECDYMSDDFLAKCIKSTSECDLRPGLIHNRTKQRQIAIEKRKAVNNEENKKRHKSHALIETERRDEGLRETISTTNKGFAMMQKMGYQPGKAIGKSGVGLVEPVSISLKSDRGGLGRESALKEVAEAKILAVNRWRMRRKEEDEIGTKDYRLRVAAEARKRQAEGDLRTSQKSCYHLDEEHGYEEPIEKWFWPEAVTRQNEEICEELDKKESVIIDSEEEHSISSDSKGKQKGEEVKSKNLPDVGTDKEKEEDDEDDEEDEELEPEEKLEVLTEYLRKTYFFCTWCGTKFDDQEDLEANCPGKTRDDH